MKRLAPAGLFLAALVAGCGQPSPDARPAASAPIELKPVTVAELTKFLESQKGKVVLVDCWFLGCGPCVKKFPEFVKLHDTYAEKGLVCVSLNVYPPEWKEKKDVEAFLAEKKATFTNFIFKDQQMRIDDWQDKYDANTTPNYLVWDRQGNRVKLPYPQKADAVEKVLVELLDTK